MEAITALAKHFEEKVELGRCTNQHTRGQPVDVHAKRSLLG